MDSLRVLICSHWRTDASTRILINILAFTEENISASSSPRREEQQRSREETRRREQGTLAEFTIQQFISRISSVIFYFMPNTLESVNIILFFISETCLK